MAVLTEALRRGKIDPLPTVTGPDGNLPGLASSAAGALLCALGARGRLTLGFREGKGHRIVGLQQSQACSGACREVPGQLQGALEGLALGPWLTHLDAVADEGGTGGWSRLAFRGRGASPYRL